MLTLYTAIGTLKFQKCSNGKSLPTVVNNDREYGLSDHEPLLWSCLAFQVLQIHELEDAYEYRLKNSDQKQALPFSHYLNRLLLRGIVVKGEGVTGVDALYRLFGELHIVSVSNTFPIRLFTYIQLRLEGKVHGADIGKYLKKEKYTPMEETILRLARAVPLTTAELVACVDLGKDYRQYESGIPLFPGQERETTAGTLLSVVFPKNDPPRKYIQLLSGFFRI